MRETLLEIHQLVIICLIAIIPIVFVIYFLKSPLEWLTLGGLAWTMALGKKYLLTKSFCSFFDRSNPFVVACGQGLLSAISELGITLFLFIYMLYSLSITAAIAFGVGASSFEIAYIVAYSFTKGAHHTRQTLIAAWKSGASNSLCVRYSMVIERFSALFGHIGSRGLIFLSVVWQNPTLTLVAILMFSIVDAVAIYGGLIGWNLFSPRICRSFYLFTVGVSFIEFTTFFALIVLNCLSTMHL
jgi:hypothetical protein